MTNIESLKPTPPKPWGIIATALWALLTVLISAAVMLIVALVALALWTGGRLGRSQDLMSNGPLLSLLVLVSTVVQVEVLVWVARRRGWQAGDYLGWIVPKPRDVAVTLAVIVVLGLAEYALYYLLASDLAVPPWQINTYRSAREAGSLVMLWVAFVVAGPLNEEIMFRGFLYRGWARSPRAVVPAVVIISALWAILHVGDYQGFFILQLFLDGLVLGWVRWRSGSTMLTFALHAFSNTWAMVATHREVALAHLIG